MKMKNKGKVHPSPPPPPPSSSSSSSHYLNEDDSLSVLKLLPATILVLVSVLSVDDREVLAYLITRGTTISYSGNCGSSSSSVDLKKTKNKKKKKKNKSSKNHKPPVFDCECFDCYTNYWFRWDSSPNRELIHQIIEAFENHYLTSGQNSATGNNKSKKGKKKVKSDNKPVVEVEPMMETLVSESHVSATDNSPLQVEEVVVEEEEEEATVVLPAVAATGHKGLARKVLPDVLGLFNSNFWRLWNPNA